MPLTRDRETLLLAKEGCDKLMQGDARCVENENTQTSSKTAVDVSGAVIVLDFEPRMHTQALGAASRSSNKDDNTVRNMCSNGLSLVAGLGKPDVTLYWNKIRSYRMQRLELNP